MSLRSEVIRIVNELIGNSKKISELPAATTPLTGTELMEVVQGGISKRVAKSDVSSGGGGGGDALTTNPLSQFAATTSAQLAGVISDETGSGALVFAISPTFITPALGTPISGVATNLTGTASGLTAGNVTTNANLTGDVTSVGNATTIGANKVLTSNILDANVTLAKMGNVATGTVFYRKTAATGVPEVQTLATLKTDLGLTGTNSGDQTLPVKATAAELTTGSDDAKFATALALENSKYLNQSGSKLSATATGTDTYVATITPAITAYTSTQRFFITFTNANTGAATLNLNALGAISLRKNTNAALVSGDIVAGTIMMVCYDGTNFQILGTWNDQTKEGKKEIEVVSTTTYTFVAADRNKIKVFTNASGCTADFPTGLPANFFVDAYCANGAGTITFTKDVSITLESSGTTITAKQAVSFFFRTSTILVGIFGIGVPLSAVNGGTGQTTVTTGDILYGSASNTWSKLPAVAIGSILGSAGVTTAPAYLAVDNGIIATATTVKWGGPLTANTTISGAFSTTFNHTIPSSFNLTGSWTSTASAQANNVIAGSFTARATASDRLFGTRITTALIAGANTQILSALDITPTFTNGAFTSVVNAAVTIQTGRVIIGNPVTLSTARVVIAAAVSETVLSLRNSSDATAFTFLPTGSLGFGGASTFPTIKATLGVVITPDVTGSCLRYDSVMSKTLSNGYGHYFGNNDTAYSDNTSGNVYFIAQVGGFAATAGTVNYTALHIAPTINQSTTATGRMVIVDINPAITSVTGTLYGLLVQPTTAFNGFGMSTPTAVLDIAASDTTRASLRLRSGTAPTTPNDGDVWYDGTNIKIRVGATTRTFTLI